MNNKFIDIIGYHVGYHANFHPLKRAKLLLSLLTEQVFLKHVDIRTDLRCAKCKLSFAVHFRLDFEVLFTCSLVDCLLILCLRYFYSFQALRPIEVVLSFSSLFKISKIGKSSDLEYGNISYFA